MASLITITDLEVASGKDITTADEPKYQWYIDAVSDYITEYTDSDFALHTSEVLVCQADGRGIIEIPTLKTVTLVQEWDQFLQTYTSLITGDYRFDGISKILYLVPYETYRITVTYGYATVPAPIKRVATQLVLAGTGLDPTSFDGLKSFRIGDKEEVYGITTGDNGMPVVSMAGFQRMALDAYGNGTRTLRL